jgi:hypothetical protein
MVCDATNQPVAEIIEIALLIAGKSADSGVNPGVWVARAKNALNRITAQWGVTDLYNFYLNEIVFTGDSSKLNYKIGIGLDIDTQPFNTITSMWYTYGGSTIPIQYQTMQSFNYFTFQSQVGMPRIFTYNNQDGVTNLKILPRSIAGLQITINGKQQIGELSLFDSNIKIPDYAKNALIYSLANELFAMGAGTPNDNFNANLAAHMQILKDASKQDRQMELKPVTTSIGAGRGVGCGTYWGGGGYGGGW